MIVAGTDGTNEFDLRTHWVATSNAAWVVIGSERSGSGTQALQFTVEPNGTGAPRVGTITFTAPGQTPLTFTINQEM